MGIDVQYFADSDTLSLRTGAPAADAEEIAEGVVVDFDADRNVVGFMLERAAALLRPVLDTAPAVGHAVGGEESATDDQQLEITLRSMGKACFVKYYEHGDDPALAQRIEEAEPYTRKSCQSRASCIRRVIRCGRGEDALENIANSGKLDMGTRQRAAALLAQLRSRP